MGYAFQDGVWQDRDGLTSLCAVGTLRLDYRNVVSLGFALQKLRPVLWCVICSGLETVRLQSAQLGNSALCMQRPFQSDS